MESEAKRSALVRCGIRHLYVRRGCRDVQLILLYERVVRSVAYTFTG